VTSKAGVFVGGAFQEPKDIPETVMQASAAAAMAMELLSSSKNTSLLQKNIRTNMMLQMKNPE
jgi:heterodisulfide reductase subunit A